MTVPDERLAQVEQRVSDHISECEKAAKRNDSAHQAILTVLRGVNARLWGLILGLLAASIAVVARLSF